MHKVTFLFFTVLSDAGFIKYQMSNSSRRVKRVLNFLSLSLSLSLSLTHTHTHAHSISQVMA